MPIKYDNNKFSFLQTSDLRRPQAFSCFCFLFTSKTVYLNFKKFVPVLLDNNQVVWLIIIIIKVFEMNEHLFELWKIVSTSQVSSIIICRLYYTEIIKGLFQNEFKVLSE